MEIYLLFSIRTRFDAVPPGAQPTRISPEARSGPSLNNLAKNAAAKGMILKDREKI